MICEKCHGGGVLLYATNVVKMPKENGPWYEIRDALELLCGTCGGTGIVPCCEGERVHPSESPPEVAS
jgi:hypothetical protein